MNIQEIKKQISVVIQGPIDNRTYEAIDCYQDYGEVILSTWATGEDWSLLEQCDLNSNYKLVVCDYPESMANVKNPGAIFYIAATTWNGANSANLPYVLKVRTDELYPNLDVFLQNVIDYPKRIHTTDNGFWKRHPHCFSGHIFLAEKEVMTTTMEYIIHYCYGTVLPDLDIYPCESILGFFFCATICPNGSVQNWKKIFRDNIWITKCEDLPGHLHSGQSSGGRGKGFKRSTQPYPNGRKEMRNGRHNPKELYRHVREII